MHQVGQAAKVRSCEMDIIECDEKISYGASKLESNPPDSVDRVVLPPLGLFFHVRKATISAV